MATLGELERSVMDVLWSADGPLSANELRDSLDSGSGAREVAVTTVLTVLSRLEKKNFVERDRSNRPHLYRSVTSRAEHTADLMHEVLGTEPDREAALARFVGQVSPEEAATLRSLLSGVPTR